MLDCRDQTIEDKIKDRKGLINRFDDDISLLTYVCQEYY